MENGSLKDHLHCKPFIQFLPFLPASTYFSFSVDGGPLSLSQHRGENH